MSIRRRGAGIRGIMRGGAGNKGRGSGYKGRGSGYKRIRVG